MPGLNQGLIFYHFGSVANLLLAALDAVSARRMEHYGAAIERVGSPTELVDVATSIFREDLDAGYVSVLVEMIAGASSTPGLGAEVSARLGPWFAFAEQAVTTTLGSPLDSVVPPADVAYGDRRPLPRAGDADATSTGIGPERSGSSPTPRTWPHSSRPSRRTAPKEAS